MLEFIFKSKCFNETQTKSDQQKTTSIGTWNESHPYWKTHFLKKATYFGTFANFGADIEINKSKIENKTTTISKQNRYKNFFVVSELDVLKSDYYDYNLSYDTIG